MKLNEVSLAVEVTLDRNIEWRVVVERENGEGETGTGNRRQGFGMEDATWNILNEEPLMESGD